MNFQREVVKRLWQQVKSIQTQAIPRIQNNFVSTGAAMRSVQTKVQDDFIRRSYPVEFPMTEQDAPRNFKDMFLNFYIIALLFGLTGGAYYYYYKDFKDNVEIDIDKMQRDFDKHRLPMQEVKKEALATVAKLMHMEGYEFTLLEDYLESNRSSLPTVLESLQRNKSWSEDYNTILQSTVHYYMKPTISLDDRFVDDKHKLLRETELEVQIPILCHSKATEGRTYHLFIAKLQMHNMVPDTYMHCKLYDFHFVASKVEIINPYQYLKSTIHLKDYQPMHQLFSYWTHGMKSKKSEAVANMLPGGFRIEKYWSKMDHPIKLQSQNTHIDLSLQNY